MNKLNLMGSVSNTGYGVVTKNILRQLKDRYEISLFQFGNQREEEFADLYKNCDSMDGAAPCLNIWHQFDLAKRVGTGLYAALPFFELNKFTQQEKANLRVPDELIVASEWAAGIVREELGLVSYVVPMGVDTEIFYPVEHPSEDTYAFFTIGKWEKRKGHDIICSAFNKAFEPEDDVSLSMMCHNPFLNQQQTKYWHDMYQQCRFPYKINIYPWVQTHAEVATFINEHDCGLFPSRAEGWNLELLETMACGTPVICTDYSAHTEFANEENAYLIDVEGTEKAHDGIWFHGQGEWAELDYEQEQQLIDYMRYCYDERPTNEAGIRTAKEYSWEKTSEKLEKILFSV